MSAAKTGDQTGDQTGDKIGAAQARIADTKTARKAAARAQDNLALIAPNSLPLSLAAMLSSPDRSGERATICFCRNRRRGKARERKRDWGQDYNGGRFPRGRGGEQ